jgi:hypothetical protein
MWQATQWVANRGQISFRRAPVSYPPSVAAGSGNAQYLPNPGGNTQVSLSISGAATADFITGNYVTPSFVGGAMGFGDEQFEWAHKRLNALYDSPGEIVS